MFPTLLWSMQVLALPRSATRITGGRERRILSRKGSEKSLLNQMDSLPPSNQTNHGVPLPGTAGPAIEGRGGGSAVPSAAQTDGLAGPRALLAGGPAATVKDGSGAVAEEVERPGGKGGNSRRQGHEEGTRRGTGSGRGRKRRTGLQEKGQPHERPGAIEVTKWFIRTCTARVHRSNHVREVEEGKVRGWSAHNLPFPNEPSRVAR